MSPCLVSMFYSFTILLLIHWSLNPDLAIPLHHVSAPGDTSNHFDPSTDVYIHTIHIYVYIYIYIHLSCPHYKIAIGSLLIIAMLDSTLEWRDLDLDGFFSNLQAKTSKSLYVSSIQSASIRRSTVAGHEGPASASGLAAMVARDSWRGATEGFEGGRSAW